MKRAISLGIGIIFLGALAWAGVFLYKNSRHIAPVATPLPAGEDGRMPGEGQNTTGLPLKLPPGFSIEVFAKDLPGVRVMTVDAEKILVSMPAAGKIVLLDGPIRKDLIVGLNRPHGMAWQCEQERCETLYVAETDKVSEYAYDIEAGQATFRKVLFQLPSGGNHFTRTLAFTKNPRTVGESTRYADSSNVQKLLISIGSSCNVCNEKDWRRAKVLAYDRVTGELKEFASGLRNAVFMAVSKNGQIWATDMGRDMLGDNLPPDEINIIPPSPPTPLPAGEGVRRTGEGIPNFGWPICYGKNVHDAGFDKNQYVRDPCTDKTPAHIELPAHSAPLGLTFIPKNAGWPTEYVGDLLVAFHGSWNRSEPTGYKIARIKLDAQGNSEGIVDFISGWLQKDGGALGRPVDLLFGENGVLYISDDKAGVIYKVTYRA